MPRLPYASPKTAIVCCLWLFVQVLAADPPTVSTFSIIALDPTTGELGIAVQSKVTAVGAIVPWAHAGVGAVATQAAANVQFGPLGLVLLREKVTPESCIEVLLREDPLKEARQLGVLAANGQSAAFTGSDCLDHAGHRTGENYAIQGNLLAGPEVLDAMEEAFQATTGELADRLIAALQAGQTAGGDRRGQQSAALLVVRDGWGYGGLNDRYIDLRIDDHLTPIDELARILEVQRALFPRPVQR